MNILWLPPTEDQLANGGQLTGTVEFKFEERLTYLRQSAQKAVPIPRRENVSSVPPRLSKRRPQSSVLPACALPRLPPAPGTPGQLWHWWTPSWLRVGEAPQSQITRKQSGRVAGRVGKSSKTWAEIKTREIERRRLRRLGERRPPGSPPVRVGLAGVVAFRFGPRARRRSSTASTRAGTAARALCVFAGGIPCPAFGGGEGSHGRGFDGRSQPRGSVVGVGKSGAAGLPAVLAQGCRPLGSPHEVTGGGGKLRRGARREARGRGEVGARTGRASRGNGTFGRTRHAGRGPTTSGRGTTSSVRSSASARRPSRSAPRPPQVPREGPGRRPRSG
ncbi:hypothetical protein THAOC_08783, partial [Thalassiosira oceanica]